MTRQVKVAVVGSGLAGLTATYLLNRPVSQDSDVEFEVHLFEKAPMLGMDSSSVSLPASESEAVEDAWRVDVPMRSFQGGYYPQLMALYTRLGVAFREANFTYSFSLLSPPSSTRKRQINATMIYNGSSGCAGLSMPSILDEPYYLSKGKGLLKRAFTRVWTVGLFVLLTLYIAVCYVRMLHYSLPFWRPKIVHKMTFEEWAKWTVPTNKISRWIGVDLAWKDYTQSVLLPLFSAVCTAPEEDVLRHPVEEFLDYIWLTLGTHHYVVIHGVREVVARLTANAQNIHLASTITSISPDPNDINRSTIKCDTPEGPRVHNGFHHIIFATQATRAVPLLKSYRDALPRTSSKREAVDAQLQCLEKFKYCSTIVINHTDPTLLPDNPRDQRDLNLICLDQDAVTEQEKSIFDWSAMTVPPSYTMATHVLRRPEGYPTHLPRVFQTTNPLISPEEGSILSIARLERAVLSMESKEALKGLYQEEGRKWWQCASQGSARLGKLQGAGRLANVQGSGIWICGSYVYAGIPLLEGCVVSARSVVEQGVCLAEGVSLQHPMNLKTSRPRNRAHLVY
ncbi:hypothetical protein C0993_004721 [Termitomyces sp. T159_Od127]|nr:hypothetical protein C0993_004721 [Termitomyces sp. T159_Od127]